MVASFIISYFNFTDFNFTCFLFYIFFRFYRYLQVRVLFLNSPVVADFHVMCPVFILFYTKNTFLRARLKNRNVSDVILKMYVTNVIVS